VSPCDPSWGGLFWVNVLSFIPDGFLMKSLKWIGLLTLVSCFFVIGCGGSGGGTAGDADEIAAYAAQNPSEDDSLDPDADAVDTDTAE